MTTTPHLSLPLIAAAQAQKHVTHNDALLAIDALLGCAVKDKDLGAPPSSPAEGDRYIVAAAPTGAWASKAGQVAARQDDAWRFYAPQAGWIAFVVDEMQLYHFDGVAWMPGVLAITSLQNLAFLGVGTTADAGNPLSTKLNNVLHAARAVAEGGTGSIQAKFSKEDAAKTASCLFQTGFSGRAEIGLIGDDDLAMKVSPDGAAWRERARLQASGLVLRGERDDLGNKVNFHVAKGGGAVGVTVEVTSTTGTKLADFALQTDDYTVTFRNESRSFGCITGVAPEFQVRFPPPFATSPFAVAPDLVVMNAPARLKSYAVAALPSAATAGAGALAFVTNASGGAVPAYSDGTAWRRVTDGTPVT